MILQSIKKVWCVFDHEGKVNQYSISHSKPESIKRFLTIYVQGSKFSKWRFWKNKNYNCIKVQINFTKL